MYDTILVSDGGGKIAADPEPHTDWVRHALRVNELIDNQVRSLRKRQVIGSYRSGDRNGAYWGIRSDLADFPAPGPLPCDAGRAAELAEYPTRLARTDETIQERLINWGYAIADVAMRAHVVPEAPTGAFPYAQTGV